MSFLKSKADIKWMPNKWMKFDEELNICIVSKYLSFKLLITIVKEKKKKESLSSREMWQTPPYPRDQSKHHPFWDNWIYWVS